jgi:DNA-binding CsgD family transcriptional regulator
MEMIENFLTAASKEDISQVLTQVCNKLEFDYYVYAPLLEAGSLQRVFKDESKILAAEALNAQNTLITYPGSWLRRYQEAQHQQTDPVLKNVLNTMLPTFWDDVIRVSPKDIVLNEAIDHGLRSGITVSLYGHRGQRALLSFSRAQQLKESRTRMFHSASVIQLAAQYVHEALERVTHNTKELMAPKLSIREKDCLKWAACGKTSWEIGKILRVSERTAIFHLTNATKKLQAPNRRAAVARALNLRLITL